MSEFDGLHKVLRRRAEPPRAQGLEQRILAATAGSSRKRSFLRAFGDLFVLPHPEYALAASLAAGLLVGLAFGAETGGVGAADLSDFLYATEVWL